MKANVWLAIASSKMVRLFKEVYERGSGEAPLLSGKHNGIARNLIKKFGEKSVLEKARRLYIVCREGKEFYARKGFADFTLENLSVHWNRLVGVKSKADKLKENLEQRRLADERIAKILDSRR